MTLRSTAALAAGIVLGGIVAGPASAGLIITGNFTGTVTSSYESANIFGGGVGYDNIVGQTVSGFFTYDFDQVPSNKCTAGYGCYYETGGPNWMRTQVTIFLPSASVTLITPTPGAAFQGVYNYAKDVAGYDFFGVYDENQRTA